MYACQYASVYVGLSDRLADLMTDCRDSYNKFSGATNLNELEDKLLRYIPPLMTPLQLLRHVGKRRVAKWSCPR